MACGQSNQPILHAVTGLLNLGTSEVESSFSVGAAVRAQVRRGAATLETTAPVPNTGASVLITFVTAVQNGDVLAIHASNDGFLVLDEDFRTIPAPNFAFVPFTQNIQFDGASVIAPNSGGGSNLTLTVTLTDGNGITGTLTITGTKNAINALDDTVNIPADGVSGSFTFITVMGNVFLNAAYDAGYDAALNEVAEMSVTDHVGWTNTGNESGLMNALLEESGNYLTDEAGTVLVYF